MRFPVKRLAALAVVLAAMAGAFAFSAPAASAAGSSAGNAALDWAEANATGVPYVYGGAGPSGYDCSGLVMIAFAHAGITLPHSTYAMLASPRLHQIPLSEAGRGDLLFYGSGHVEFDTVWYHTSFGAHDTGSLVGWIGWSGGWQPTMAFRVW